ncbi:MAG TPA: hypothetical protein VGB65_13540 [Allosphingosinicella sp.]|jgi:hypothetical protein
MRMIVVAAGCALVASAVALGSGVADAEARPAGGAQEAGDRLGARIEAAIKADGPFFTAEERTLIERKCGYPAGSWDGFEVNVSNGVLTCRGGKRVDDAEMRALLAVAEPRIGRRVETVMESAEVQDAIKAVADEAEREALAGIDEAKIAREAAREAEIAVKDAMAEVRRQTRAR